MDDGGSFPWGKDHCCPAIGVIVIEIWTSLIVCEVAIAELCVAV